MLTAPLSRAGETDAAIERAMRAIDLPWSRELLLTSPEFAVMRELPGFRGLIRESLLRSGLVDLESCVIEGL